jgi:hypothetical protein
MKKNRYVNTHFWDDKYIIELDAIEKLLFIYFLTNPLTNIAGIYEIQIKRIAFDTGIDREMILKILEQFEESKKIKYENGWIGIANFLKHQSIKNQKIRKGIQDSLQNVPKTLIKWVMDNLSKPMDESITSLIYINNNHNNNHNNKTPPKYVELAKLLYVEHKRHDDKFLVGKNLDHVFQQWGDDIRKLCEIDKRDPKEIEQVINWCQSDGCFWIPNILSGKKLREKYDMLLSQYKQTKSYEPPAAKKLICPICHKDAGNNTAAYCLVCGLEKSDFNDEKKIDEYRRTR